MTAAPSRTEILFRFIEEVWNGGRIDAADGYLAPTYTIHHDPGDPWDGRSLDRGQYRERVRTSRAMSGITVYYFDGDRICGHWQVVDRLGVFQQLRAAAQRQTEQGVTSA